MYCIYVYFTKSCKGVVCYITCTGPRRVSSRLGSILLLIITLFQEDNIFGMDTSLTYGPQLKGRKVDMSLISEQAYLQYVRSR